MVTRGNLLRFGGFIIIVLGSIQGAAPEQAE